MSVVLLSASLTLAATGDAVGMPEAEAIAVESPKAEAVGAIAQLPPPTPAEPLDLDPQLIESSPVLQRWLEEIPDVRSDILNDPAFRTRVRLGYVQFTDANEGGISVGVEDIFLGRTGFTIGADYQRTFEGDREAYGADLRYYVLPLGNYVNLAPVVGYRRLAIEDNTIDGVNLGARLQLALSRTGAADIAVSQTWVNPGSNTEEVGITTLSLGYAVTANLRLSTDIQRQNAPQNKETRLGLFLEWMP